MSKTIFVVREDVDGDSPTLGDIITVPDADFEKIEERGVLEYFAEVTREYWRRRGKPYDELELREFFALPAEYLAGKNIKIEPIDTDGAVHLASELKLPDEDD